MKKTLLLFVIFAGSLLHAQTIALDLFAEGFTSPVEITNAGDSRLFVVQQNGQIKILNSDGTTNSTLFLNVSSLISSGGERGLLGLAFHPDYSTNGYFYINYTNTSGNTVVARYSRSTTNPDVADPASAQIVLTVNQPSSNHNGGCLRFGPDGYLYISMGDGGGAGDTSNNAQNINSLLGKMLRIDVDNGSPYSSPAGNPYVGVGGADEIYATGLRNAWKFSFDSSTGDMWIADVGQNAIEEINKVTSGTGAGLNFGWRCYEGNSVYNSSGCQPASAYTMPFTQYAHSLNGGCSITGGYVYRGAMYPALQGKYIFSDYCNNRIGMADATGSLTFTTAFSGNNFATFGEDVNAEMYVGGKTSGKIYKLRDSSMGIADVTRAGFSVYPNPANDVVQIKSVDGSIASQAAIYDLSGKLLLQQKLSGGEDAIATSSLTSGLYLLTIRDNTGTETSLKLSIK